MREFGRFDETVNKELAGKLGRFGRTLVVVAHPDDETFCSGLVCELVEGGSEVIVLCLTRGEGGPTAQWTREELGDVREREMREACELLGIAQVVFLGHVDPVANGEQVYAPKVAAEDLAGQVTPWLEQADLVISHGSSGEYWHPAHLLVYSACEIAMRSCPEARWISFLAQQPDHPLPRIVNEGDAADFSIDVSPFHERRLEALRCHRSQEALFARFADGTVEDFVRKTSRETYCLHGG